jgi:gamma-glutamylcyclotransferase (GGCT)/AIG2-like uncharacterized protein YtfP
MAVQTPKYNESDDEWDFCNDYTAKPPSPLQSISTIRGKGYVAAVDGHLSGLVKSREPFVRACLLSPEYNPAKIPSDADYKRNLMERDGGEHQPTNNAETLQKIKNVYDSVLAEKLPNSLILAAQNKISSDEMHAFGEKLEREGNSNLPFFFYGSAMFPSIVKQIANLHGDLRRVASQMTPALLTGYTRHAVRGKQSFPAIIASGSLASTVNGMVVFGIEDKARKSIHRFEGGMFDLRKCSVVVDIDGEVGEIECGVYIWNGDKEKMVPIQEREWSLRDLIESEWHLGNMKAFREEEMILGLEGCSHD